MRHQFFAPLALLAACSGPTPAGNDTDAGPSAPESVAADATPVVAATRTDTVVPKPGALRTFRDWAAGCDNIARCTIAALSADGGAFAGVAVTIARAPGPAGGFTIDLDPVAGDGGAPVAILIDGTRFAVAELSGARADAFVRALAQGRAMTILDADDQIVARPSLSGAAAAMRWIDDRQGRVDTVTAAVARGVKPATAVPAAQGAPIVTALRAGGIAATPSQAQITRMRAMGQCNDDYIVADPTTFPVETFALGGGATLALMPCSAGAYNISAALFILRDGALAAAVTDTPSGFDATGAEGEGVPSVVNGDWSDGVLTSYAKGRGLGDCGVRQRFVWDGRRLRLIAQAEMSECRGNPNFIGTWQAKVVRR